MKAAEPELPPSPLLAGFDRLTRPGLFADYVSVEVTEVMATPPGGKPVNVLTVAVCEEISWTRAAGRLAFLGDRISLPGLKGWTFGVARYRRKIRDFRDDLLNLGRTGRWEASGHHLTVGNLTPQPAAFVQADGLDRVALNAVLKNNFYDGCYVIELADPVKNVVTTLLEPPSRLARLGELVVERGGPGLEAVSDRLGNLLIQFPIEVVAFDWSRTPEGVGVVASWRPGVTPRSLIATAAVEAEGVLRGYATADTSATQVSLAIGHHRRPHQATVWDRAEGVLLAATGPQAFITQINTTMRIPTGHRRLRTGGAEIDIPVEESLGDQMLGEPLAEPNGPWEGRRIYRATSDRLAATREFVAYGGGREASAEGRARALDDLRFLINRHGEHGVWLWDPYLSADDLLETLIRSRHRGVAMRAITAGSQAPGRATDPLAGKAGPRAWIAAQRQALIEAVRSIRKGSRPAGPTRKQVWIAAQNAALENRILDAAGLNLEYRIAHDGGWPFHDRFLIFPTARGAAQAWSLGASVNHAGMAHHILQKVPDGQRIADDFQSLWDALDAPAQCVWRHPS